MLYTACTILYITILSHLTRRNAEVGIFYLVISLYNYIYVNLLNILVAIHWTASSASIYFSLCGLRIARAYSGLLLSQLSKLLVHFISKFVHFIVSKNLYVSVGSVATYTANCEGKQWNSKTGHLSVPKGIVGTPGQAAQKRDCPVKNGTYGHLARG